MQNGSLERDGVGRGLEGQVRGNGGSRWGVVGGWQALAAATGVMIPGPGATRDVQIYPVLAY